MSGRNLKRIREQDRPDLNFYLGQKSTRIHMNLARFRIKLKDFYPDRNSCMATTIRYLPRPDKKPCKIDTDLYETFMIHVIRPSIFCWPLIYREREREFSSLEWLFSLALII